MKELKSSRRVIRAACGLLEAIWNHEGWSGESQGKLDSLHAVYFMNKLLRFMDKLNRKKLENH